MSKYYVTKLVSGRWVYYLQGLDACGRPQWNGLNCNGKEYGKITATQIMQKLNATAKKEEHDIMPTQHQHSTYKTLTNE